MSDIDITISEVGPRDGLQSLSQIMPTEDKKRWITALAAAGLPEIEVGSFVPAKNLPQLADTAEMVAHARKIEGLSITALVPNFRGAQNAVKTGIEKISIPLSVSETHSQRNLKRSHEQVLDEVRRIRALIDSLPVDERPHFEGGLATAFGCTIEGPVAEEQVVRLAEQLMEAGCDEVGLSDTTGYANPTQIKRLSKKVWDAVGRDKLSGVHLHNTRGQGLANALAAIEVGMTTVDASMGGIGGCPHAPGASGNIVTEDLVFMLEAMGLKTGVDFDKLMAARALFVAAMPGVEVYGFAANAGLPIGFEYA